MSARSIATRGGARFSLALAAAVSRQAASASRATSKVI